MTRTSPTGHSYKFLPDDQRREAGLVVHAARQRYRRGQAYMDQLPEWEGCSPVEREEATHVAETLLEWWSRQ